MVQVFEGMVGMLAIKYPDDLKNPAISIVSAAMAVAYPCLKRPQAPAAMRLVPS
jgi:hypothetical protein